MTAVNKNASPEAITVLEYLNSIKGNGILTGQHTQTMEQKELGYIESVTGKLPALCGFELLAYSPNINYDTCDEAALKEIYENRGTIQRAYEWAERGGLITFTWHWYSPIGGRDKSFFTKNTDFDAAQVLIEGTPEREAFFSDMDAMAEILKGFNEKHIPILWRPFHESEGDWFWWSAKGMDTARELFRLMYYYYTKEKQLDNLIWVWNNPRPEGYVGDEYCDILTADFYPPAHEHTSLKAQHDRLATVTANKPLAIGELGTFPSISEMAENDANWLWFMIWSGDFAASENYVTKDVLKEQYAHPYAITFDKLPKWAWCNN